MSELSAIPFVIPHDQTSPSERHVAAMLEPVIRETFLPAVDAMIAQIERRFIDNAAAQAEIHHREIDMIDKGLRQSQADLKDAARVYHQAADGLQQTNLKLLEVIGGLTKSDQNQDHRLDKVEATVTDIQRQIQILFSSQNAVSKALFGDSTLPNMPYLTQQMEAVAKSVLEIQTDTREIKAQQGIQTHALQEHQREIEALKDYAKRGWWQRLMGVAG